MIGTSGQRTRLAEAKRGNAAEMTKTELRDRLLSEVLPIMKSHGFVLESDYGTVLKTGRRYHEGRFERNGVTVYVVLGEEYEHPRVELPVPQERLHEIITFLQDKDDV